MKLLLWEVRSKYANLGYSLGLDVASVTSIEQSYKNDADKCFNQVLIKVLLSGLSRNKLAEALEGPTLKYIQLAKKVRTANLSELLCVHIEVCGNNHTTPEIQIL